MTKIPSTTYQDSTPFVGQLLLDRHRALDIELRLEQKKVFVSGWHTSHPFAGAYLPSDVRRHAGDPLCYAFLSDDIELCRKIISFHTARGEEGYQQEEVFVTAGASPLILAEFLLLRAMSVRRAHFISPIYYTYFYFAKMFGIELVPVSDSPLHSPHNRLTLPEETTHLFVTDPIWIMGVQTHPDHWDTLVRWQRRTGSLIFVDGTFQYFSWRNPTAGEQSAALDRERTIRLVCPTKSVAIHGVRFAYLLLPRRYREDVRYACSNTTGATGVFDSFCAHHIMNVLASSEANSALIEYVKRRHDRLRRAGIFGNPASEPSASYYTFVELLSVDRDRYLCMGQEYFGLSQFPRHIRFNLLTPHCFPGEPPTKEKENG